MSLKTCPDCKKQISGSAQICMHCGRELAFWNHPLKLLMVSGIVIILTLAGIFFIAWIERNR